MLQEVHYTPLAATAGSRCTVLSPAAVDAPLPSSSSASLPSSPVSAIETSRGPSRGKERALVIGKGGTATLVEVSRAGKAAGASSDEFLAVTRFPIFVDTDGAEVVSACAVPRLSRGMPPATKEMERARDVGIGAFAVAFAERSDVQSAPSAVDSALSEAFQRQLSQPSASYERGSRREGGARSRSPGQVTTVDPSTVLKPKPVAASRHSTVSKLMGADMPKLTGSRQSLVASTSGQAAGVFRVEDSEATLEKKRRSAAEKAVKEALTAQKKRFHIAIFAERTPEVPLGSAVSHSSNWISTLCRDRRMTDISYAPLQMKYVGLAHAKTGLERRNLLVTGSDGAFHAFLPHRVAETAEGHVDAPPYITPRLHSAMREDHLRALELNVSLPVEGWEHSIPSSLSALYQKIPKSSQRDRAREREKRGLSAGASRQGPDASPVHDTQRSTDSYESCVQAPTGPILTFDMAFSGWRRLSAFATTRGALFLATNGVIPSAGGPSSHSVLPSASGLRLSSESVSYCSSWLDGPMADVKLFCSQSDLHLGQGVSSGEFLHIPSSRKGLAPSSEEFFSLFEQFWPPPPSSSAVFDDTHVLLAAALGYAAVLPGAGAHMLSAQGEGDEEHVQWIWGDARTLPLLGRGHRFGDSDSSPSLAGLQIKGGLPAPLLLPHSDMQGAITSVEAFDADMDGLREIVVGTADGSVLLYSLAEGGRSGGSATWRKSLSDSASSRSPASREAGRTRLSRLLSSELVSSESSFELVGKKRLHAPIRDIQIGDMSGEGFDEVIVTTSESLHILQPSSKEAVEALGESVLVLQEIMKAKQELEADLKRVSGLYS